MSINSSPARSAFADTGRPPQQAIKTIPGRDRSETAIAVDQLEEIAIKFGQLISDHAELLGPVLLPPGATSEVAAKEDEFSSTLANKIRHEVFVLNRSYETLADVHRRAQL